MSGLSEVVVHACPSKGSARTPCCSLSPFELPHHHRITTDPEAVTCWTSGDPRFIRAT